MSYRSGQPVTGRFLLYRTYNPSASHSRSTSPYTGEARGGGRKRASFSLVPRPKRGGFTGGTWFLSPPRKRCGALFHVKHFPGLLPLRARRGKRSPAADAGLGCSKNRPLRARTGGSGGHFAFGTKAPRRPFCPLSAGGKWTNAPPRKRGGGPVSFDRLGRRTKRLPAA